jgi:hypothetical protein
MSTNRLGSNGRRRGASTNIGRKSAPPWIDPALHPDFGRGGARLGFETDAPGWSNERTLRLTTLADLMILSATPSIADLRPLTNGAKTRDANFSSCSGWAATEGDPLESSETISRMLGFCGMA